MITGILFCVAGLIHGVFKYFVIRSAARDIYNGGGVPVLDFVVFVPLWLAYGISSILKHDHVYPFPYFGIVLYFVLVAGVYVLMQLEYRRGKPEVERQLEMMLVDKRVESGSAKDGGQNRLE